MSSLPKKYPRHKARVEDKVSKSPAPANSTPKRLGDIENVVMPPAIKVEKEELSLASIPRQETMDTMDTTVGGDNLGTGQLRMWVGTLLEAKNQATMLVTTYKNTPNPDKDGKIKRRVQDVEAFLWWLDNEVEVNPGLKSPRGPVDQILGLLKKTNFIPAHITIWAGDILARFEEDNWGADDAGQASDSETVMGEQEHEQAPEPPQRAPAGPSSAPMACVASDSGTANLPIPPVNHPIWGERGIMHGLCMKRGKTTSYSLNPNLKDKKADAKVFGHNNLTPGDWWPMQKAALFHGAHGAPISGISGTPELGAYSIVTSGRSTTYGDMDEDHGDVLYYSGDQSTDNVNPTRVIMTSSRTQSLEKSMQTRRPVRVLRSSGGSGVFHPPVGIRYDGLYRVTERLQKFNKKGGMYYQFKLIRDPGQTPLKDICKNSPGRQQLLDEAKIRDGY
ncbi:PUA-like domain-containing protein [Lasiosphaeria miniovina]|uniref:PUA-like domain-containing protein n=1 Tax=Lasiosphaeria miniovina TaxID=1954250 RepID=A0AA40DTB3_9PEZI|nr:PUA-like domain-containing protein [Lasiosphaeria miniovina]KAK0712582.1 PUA-like domain-containing protein [Lasiosphaeria miniovina]